MQATTQVNDGHRSRPRGSELDIDEKFEDAEVVVDEVLKRHPRYRLYVHRIDTGLYRMTLTDRDQIIGQKEGFEGVTVREMYTWRRQTMEEHIVLLNDHRNPPAYCTGLVTDWNALDRDGPISLDSTRYSRAAFVPNQPELRRWV